MVKKIQVCTTIMPDLYDEAKKNGVSFSQAVDLGCRKLLAMGKGEDLRFVNDNINETRKALEKMRLTMQKHIDARVKLQAEVDILKNGKN